MKRFIRAYFAVCFGVLCYSGIIISQIHEADKIQIHIEYQIEPMFNSLMDKVYTGQVYPFDYEGLKPIDLDVLENITNIESALRAEMD